MDGIIVIDKPKGITSRDVVNKLCKILNTKKIGHTGTLDPIATGVLVVCVGKATKLVELLTSNDKEYVATVKLGLLTDTLDTDGKVIKRKDVSLDESKLRDVILSFVGSYDQEVPIYSAVKINGKKLYEYARENKQVEIPKRKVEIKNIELISVSKDSYKFKVKVSKGTYIRSLIKDINEKAQVIGVMSDLRRIKQGKFSIEDSCKLEDVVSENLKLCSIENALSEYKKVVIDSDMFNKIKNGSIIENVYNDNMILFVYENKVIAIYKKYEKDNSKMKPYKMFI